MPMSMIYDKPLTERFLSLDLYHNETCSIVSGLCPKREEYRGTICNEEAGSLKNVKKL